MGSRGGAGARESTRPGIRRSLAPLAAARGRLGDSRDAHRSPFSQELRH